MVLIRAETLVPYGCTCDRSAAAKEDDGVRIRGALLPSCWQLKALSRRMVPLFFPKNSLRDALELYHFTPAERSPRQVSKRREQECRSGSHTVDKSDTVGSWAQFLRGEKNQLRQ